MLGKPVTVPFSADTNRWTGFRSSTALAGTVSLSANSATVAGAGTSFTTLLQAGQSVVFSADTTATQYEILAIASNTSLTLTAAYQGATASGSTMMTVGDVDAAGNQTGQLCSMCGAAKYDAEGRLMFVPTTSTSSQAVRYYYDGNGKRVMKVLCAAGTWTCDASSQGAVITTFVYDAAGELAAEYSPSSPDAGRKFLFTDGLVSTRLYATETGTVTNCYDYLPFGEEISQGYGGRSSCYGTAGYPAAADVVSGKFTGKERDAETGLDYFGARYLSTAHGRFTSPDGGDASTSNPQNLNRYTYVKNNPLALIDPDGNKDEPATGRLTYINTALARDKTLLNVIKLSNNLGQQSFGEAFERGAFSNLDTGVGNTLRGLAGEATVIDDINGSVGRPGTAFPSPTNLPGVKPDIGMQLQGALAVPMGLENIATPTGGLATVPLGPTVTKNYLEVKSGLSASSIGDGVSQTINTLGAIKTAGMAGTATATLVVDAGAWSKLSPAMRTAYVGRVSASGGYIQVQPGLADAARKRAQSAVDEAQRHRPNQ